ncbi:MAG: hypothetical protein JNK60_15490 [Acidobacteria bacterium]|nr:hypothetical protein [Acidobacteriota bacterium]
MRHIANVLALTLLTIIPAGCFSATKYRAQTGHRGGYSDVRLDERTFKVSFGANDDTARTTVEAYLLYRCAELTVEAGYHHFVIVEASGGWAPVDPDGGPPPPSTDGLGPWAPPAQREHERHHAPVFSALIKVSRGDRPQGGYDAKQYLSHMTSRIRR